MHVQQIKISAFILEGRIGRSISNFRTECFDLLNLLVRDGSALQLRTYLGSLNWEIKNRLRICGFAARMLALAAVADRT